MNENERMLDLALADANDELRVLRLRVTQMQADLEALAQPAQKPVAWLLYRGERTESFWFDKGDAYDLEMRPEHRWEPLYTTPPQRPWVDEAAIRADERERIKAANAPEIERINAYIKSLEDAVQAEREACAKFFENHWREEWTDEQIAEAIRARGNT